MFQFVGQYNKAEQYLQKALTINREIGDKEKKASAYGNLGTVFLSVCQYTKTEEYLQKALTINREIGDRKKEASDYGNLGTVFQSVGHYTKAKECLQKAPTIRRQIGDKRGVVASNLNLGNLCRVSQDYTKSNEFTKKALEMSYEVGDIELQFFSHLGIALNTLLAGGDITVILRNLYESIEKCEEMHDFLRGKNQFKIYFFDEHACPYHLLCWLFIMA